MEIDNLSTAEDSELYQMIHEAENTLWQARNGDGRVYTLTVVRTAQDTVRECMEELERREVINEQR